MDSSLFDGDRLHTSEERIHGAANDPYTTERRR